MKNSNIHLFNMFSLNYDYDFIRKVWAGNENMIDHLSIKFKVYYDQVGSYGVMLKFWANLDSSNRQILEDWIVSNYKG